MEVNTPSWNTWMDITPPWEASVLESMSWSFTQGKQAKMKCCPAGIPRGSRSELSASLRPLVPSWGVDDHLH